jgi:hypothetical protein
LLPVVLYRVGMATAWTTMGVVTLCMLSLLGRMGEIPAVSYTTDIREWFTTSGWWMAVVIFAWSAVRQSEHVWDDLNRATQQ